MTEKEKARANRALTLKERARVFRIIENVEREIDELRELFNKWVKAEKARLGPGPGPGQHPDEGWYV